MSTTTCSGNCGGICASCVPAGASAALPGRRGLVVPSRTYAAFKSGLLDSIARAPALSAFTTRADDDPSIALVDAWSMSLHVLSFYVERYQGESYIDTATDVSAVDALARMVGYQPVPAISAGTVLTFGVDNSPSAPPVAEIPKGAKVQDVPRSGETAVVFETSEALEARATWNELRAKRREMLTTLDPEVPIKETVIQGRPGDVIARIKSNALGTGYDFAMARIERLEASPMPLPTAMPKDIVPPYQILHVDQWSASDPLADLKGTEFHIFSRRAALFGNNASQFRLLSREVRERVYMVPITEDNDITDTHAEWPRMKGYVIRNNQTDTITADIDLDAVYPEAFRGRYVLLDNGTTPAEIFKIQSVREVVRTDFGVSSKVSRLTLDRTVDNFALDTAVRSTSVSIQTETVERNDSAITRTMPDVPSRDSLELADPCDVPAGRLVVVRDAKFSEAAIVKRIDNNAEGKPKVVVFEKALVNPYDPQTLVVLGNAVRATHGETKMPPAVQGDLTQVRPEVIGSGDARKRYQAFALRQPGLTYVSADNPVGYAPEIEVRVDGVRRLGADNLYGLDEGSRAYALEPASDGSTLVRFAGRLRTSPENVTAIYRVGGGSGGNLERDRLIVPLTPSPGLRSATNPVPAEGGADPEGIESARLNAPIRIVTLDRIVSLADYGAFARAYGTISKALASLVWVDGRQVVHITVAGPLGANVPAGSDLYLNLESAIRKASAPGRAFKLLDYRPRPFRVVLALRSDPDRRRADVAAAVGAAFSSALSPAAREFGAPVAKSLLLALAQNVPGVVASRVVKLRATDPTAPDDEEILGAGGATATEGAELLFLDAGGLTFQEMNT
jgi:hypothetical protein